MRLTEVFFKATKCFCLLQVSVTKQSACKSNYTTQDAQSLVFHKIMYVLCEILCQIIVDTLQRLIPAMQ